MIIKKYTTIRGGLPSQNFQKRKSYGFTLVETMVAIAILLISVVAPISLMGDSLHKLYYAKDQIIAINLAQEGIEVVRATGATSMLQGQSISQKIMQGSIGIPPVSYYIIDVDHITASGHPDFTLLACDTFCIANYQDIYLDSNGLYRQKNGSPTLGWTKTQFKRLVTATEIETTREIKVESRVTWITGGQQGTITVTENIFNWAL